MSIQRYQRSDLAANQLETAIELYIGGHDKFSVITLAAAADGILSQLVTNRGGENFIDFSLRTNTDTTLTRGELSSQINDIVRINELKHMDRDDDGYVVMDVDQCALASITKAIANFVALRGRGVNFIEAFLLWMRVNLDPKIYNVNCDPNWEPAGEHDR